MEGGKPENPEKNPRSRKENQQQTQATCDAGSGNRTWDTLVRGKRSDHCAIPAPLAIIFFSIYWPVILLSHSIDACFLGTTFKLQFFNKVK